MTDMWEFSSTHSVSQRIIYYLLFITIYYIISINHLVIPVFSTLLWLCLSTPYNEKLRSSSFSKRKCLNRICHCFFSAWIKAFHKRKHSACCFGFQISQSSVSIQTIIRLQVEFSLSTNVSCENLKLNNKKVTYV